MLKQYGIIGYPLGHSMSPLIHKELFSFRGYEGCYEKYEIVPEKLKDAFHTSLCHLDGFNITIPHKIAIMSFCDEVEELAAEYGAVNVISKKDGRYIGYNTDAYGFLKGLEFSDIPLKGRVMVYGYGGAARTLITESVKAGCEVFVGTTSDRKKNADTVVAEIIKKQGKEIKVLTNEEITEEFDLFINASPVGMYPNINASPIAEKQVELFRYVYDIVYNPTETELLRFAREKGKICGGGMSMLVCQAIKGHQHWYGAEFSREEAVLITEKAVKEMERIFSK